VSKLDGLLKRLGLRKDVGAPVHVGANPVYFTYIYSYRRSIEAVDTWVFSWHTSDHTLGGQFESFSKVYTENQRDCWERNKAKQEHATFVRDQDLHDRAAIGCVKP
jgi:hypothetical protein